MRSSKRVLAGFAAGALGAALVPVGLVAAATPAQAATYAVTAQFPSMTIVQTADDSIQIGLETSLNGEDTSIASTTVALTITNSLGVSVLNSGGTTDDSKFNVDDSALSDTDLATGVGKIVLMTGNSTPGGGNFSAITPGSYTLGLTWINNSSGVGVASTTMPITIVSAAAAGSITGSGRYLSTGLWSTATTRTSASVATDDSINGQTRYVAFLNATSGPIVAPATMYTAVAAPNRAAGTTSLTEAITANGTQPGIVTLTSSATGDSGTWSSSAGAGSVVTAFAAPVDQITATLPVSIAASATIASAAVTSDVYADLASQNGSDVQITVPARNGVKFKVSGVTQVGGTATAGVQVTFSVAAANNTNVLGGTSYSSISPVSTTVVTSGAGGAFSLEYTVSNPVNATGARVTFSVPGQAAKTAFVRFSTPTIAGIDALPTNITTANSGTIDVYAYPYDQFGEGLTSWPVQVSVSGVGATVTPATVTTNADGQAKYTITIPAGTLSGATSTVLWTAWNGAAFATYTATTSVSYTGQSAAVTALTATGSFNGAATSYSNLTGGALNAAANPMFVNTQWNDAAAYTPAQDGFSWKVQVVATNVAGTVIAGAPVTITGANGGKVLSSTGRWADSRTSYSSATGVVTFVLTSHKTGVAEWAVSSGTASSKVTAVYANRPTDARYIDISASSTEIIAGNGATIVATVTDRYGNPVAGVPVSFGETGPGYIAGTGAGTTAATGKAEATYVTVNGQEGPAAIDVTAGNGVTATVAMPSALPSTAAQVPAAATSLYLQVGNAADVVTSYAIPTAGLVTTSITGVTKGVATKGLTLTVKPGSATKSITITGARATVSGKPGIEVLGSTTGLAGKTVIPYVRFPGGEYTQGTARPAVTAIGEFEWSRKTGKKAYVYFTNDDGAVSSNRIIIAAS